MAGEIAGFFKARLWPDFKVAGIQGLEKVAGNEVRCERSLRGDFTFDSSCAIPEVKSVASADWRDGAACLWRSAGGCVLQGFLGNAGSLLCTQK